MLTVLLPCIHKILHDAKYLISGKLFNCNLLWLCKVFGTIRMFIGIIDTITLFVCYCYRHSYNLVAIIHDIVVVSDDLSHSSEILSVAHV